MNALAANDFEAADLLALARLDDDAPGRWSRCSAMPSCRACWTTTAARSRQPNHRDVPCHDLPQDPPVRDHHPGQLDGRDTIAGQLSDEVSWLRQCADWLAHLDADSYPPAASVLAPADWPDRAIVAVGLERVAAVIDRIAADVDELARARRARDLNTAAVLPDLCVPRISSAALTSRVALPAVRP